MSKHLTLITYPSPSEQEPIGQHLEKYKEHSGLPTTTTTVKPNYGAPGTPLLLLTCACLHLPHLLRTVISRGVILGRSSSKAVPSVWMALGLLILRIAAENVTSTGTCSLIPQTSFHSSSYTLKAPHNSITMNYVSV